MFLIFLGLWGFVVLMALGVIAYHSYILPAIERRKKQEWEREARPPASTPWLPNGPVVDEKGSFDGSRSASPQSLHSKTPILAVSDGRKQPETLSWEESSDRAASPPPVQAPGIWARVRGMFGRKADEEEDWIADSPSRSRDLPPPLMPAPAGPVGRSLPPLPPPQRKPPPPLLGVSKPPAKMGRESLGGEQFRFPPPRLASVPMPLHHGFARPVPNDLPRSPAEFLAPSHDTAHARKSSQTLAPAMNPIVPPLRKNNPFTTPLDQREKSPFTDATDRLEPSPFADPFAPTNPFSTSPPVIGRAV